MQRVVRDRRRDRCRTGLIWGRSDASGHVAVSIITVASCARFGIQRADEPAQAVGNGDAGVQTALGGGEFAAGSSRIERISVGREKTGPRDVQIAWRWRYTLLRVSRNFANRDEAA